MSTLSQEELKNRLSVITHLFYDFDGVMTNNQVLVLPDGTEAVFCNRSDGLAVSELRKRGYEQLILSTETNPIVEHRAEKLHIPVLHSISDKGEVLSNYLIEHKLNLQQCLYIGNDINDIPAFSMLGVNGIKCCPADAEREIKEICDWVSEKNGGCGVIRDLYRIMNSGW